MTEQWFLEHAQLLAKYHLTEAQIDSIVLDDRFFAPRQGVREFLQAIDSNNITLIIVSSGLTPCIARWFKLRFDYVPEIIIANDLIIEEGKVVGVHKDSVICPLDKTIELESDKENHDIILLGDALEDMSIVENPSRTLGFTDEDGFDVRLGRDASMEKALEYLYL